MIHPERSGSSIGDREHSNFAGLTTTDAITRQLAERFHHGETFSFLDTFLVAINPRNVIPEMYSRTVAREHAAKPLLTLPPHPFGGAELISQLMRHQGKDQTIIFRGTTGSGKTTVHRVMLHYLLSRSARFTQMEQMILEASVALDAFSCARVGAEQESSRMLKATELFYDSRHVIMGARIRCFYLEQSRVTNRDGNFKVFYELCSGASDLEAKLYGLRNDFELLSESQRNAHKAEDTTAFSRLKTAMQLLSITEDQQSQVFQAVAALLHLGNLKFTTEPLTKAVSITNEASLNMAATLLGVPAGVIVKFLTTSTSSLEGSNTSVREEWQFALTERQAVALRDALLRALYQRVFECVLGHVNAALSFPESQSQNVIRLVETAGPNNGNDVDSLVMNYIVDKMHGQTWQSLFLEEQALRQEEGLPNLPPVWPDPRASLDLIENHNRGLFFLLEEARKQPSVTETSIYDAFNNAHTPHPAYRRVPSKEKEEKRFGIVHSFGERTYKTKKLIDRLRETATGMVSTLLSSSQHLTMLKQKFDGRVSAGSLEVAPSMLMGNSPLNIAVTINELCRQIAESNCSFVFCLSPSQSGLPDSVDLPHLSAQVTALGLPSVCAFKEYSFPVRIPIREFLKRYATLTNRHRSRWRRTVTMDTKARIEATFRSRESTSDRAISKNYVLLKTRAYLSLESRRSHEMERSAERIQAWWRMLVARFAYKSYRHSVILVQNGYLRDFCGLLVHLIHFSCKARIRRRLAQRRYEMLVAATTVLTSALRMARVHKEHRRRLRKRNNQLVAASSSRSPSSSPARTRMVKIQVKEESSEGEDAFSSAYATT